MIFQNTFSFKFVCKVSFKSRTETKDRKNRPYIYMLYFICIYILNKKNPMSVFLGYKETESN